MGMAELLLISVLTGPAFSPAQVERFPGPYYGAYVHTRFQRTAMSSWPGPGGLMEIWSGDQLSDDERVVWLLGASAFHDPSLLPAYGEAVLSQSQRVRQAAVFGYRDLIADRLPDVRGGIDDETARLFHQEVLLMTRTLRRNTLPALWLQSALAHEEASLPGWHGIHLNRSQDECFRAVERLMDVQDLDLLVRSYRLVKGRRARINLLKLVEGVSLSRFIVRPSIDQKGWGSYVYDDGLATLDAAIRKWSRGGCTIDGEAVVRGNLGVVDSRDGDPLASEARDSWLEILKGGNSRWWMFAAKRLYACGGPWYELAVLDPESQQNISERDALLKWYSAPPPRRQPRKPYQPS